MRIKSLRLIAAFFAVFLFLMTFSGCYSAGGNKTMMTVGSYKISENVLAVYIQMMKSNIMNQYQTSDIDYSYVNSETGETLGEVVKNGVYETIIFNTALLDLAAENGYKMSSQDRKTLKESKKEYIEECGGRREYQVRLDEMGLTDKRYDILSELFYTTEAAKNYLFGESGKYCLTDEEIAALSDKFYDEYANYMHILTATIDLNTGTELSAGVKEEKRLRSLNIYEEVKTGKKDFVEYVKQYSEDLTGTETTFNNYTTKGEMVAEFETALWALKEGEISAPVKTQYGYHIIKRLPLESEGINTLATEAVDTKVNEVIAEHQKTLTVVTTPAYDTLVIQ